MSVLKSFACFANGDIQSKLPCEVIPLRGLTENKTYPLTGSEALDYYEVAEIFTNVLGRRIVYTDPSVFNFALKMYGRGLNPGFIIVMLGIYTTARLGLSAEVTPDVRDFLQRSPSGMEEFVHSYRASWMF
jgi:uncharacterized protein YbjT (DUF2867 family)